MRVFLHRLILIFLLLTALFSSAKIGSKFNQNEFMKESVGIPKRIAIIGDTQRTMTIERIIGREQNDEEREVLMKNLEGESTDLVIMLGDFVASCNDQAGWNYFDQLMEGIRLKNIPVIGILGNHEYLGIGCKKLKEVTKRFPELKNEEWFSRTYKDIGMIFLNSNHTSIGDDEWKKESVWFHNTVKSFENDPNIKGFLVFSHHPPYTNGIIVRSDLKTRSTFVPAFQRSKKGLAFISGHVHGYERLVVDGKTYLVSAGGGGPRQKLYKDEDKKYEDKFNGPSPRPFNYVILEPQSSGLQFTTKGIEKHEFNLKTIDEFFAPFHQK